MDLTALPSIDADGAATADGVLLDVREYEDTTGGMNSWASDGHPMINHAGNPGIVI